MKIRFAFLLLTACATTRPVEHAQCDETVHPARATFYSAKRGGKCSAPIPSTHFVAMPSRKYLAACGSCLEVTGPRGSTRVEVTDECPACKGDDLDLSDQAFAEIADPKDGRVEVSWKVINCAVEGDIQLDLQGSDANYVKLRLTNTRTALASVSVQAANASTPIDARRTADNFWTFKGTAPYDFPLTVRATDVAGNEVTLSAPKLMNDTRMNGGAQFPISCQR